MQVAKAAKVVPAICLSHNIAKYQIAISISRFIMVLEQLLTFQDIVPIESVMEEIGMRTVMNLKKVQA